MQGRPSIREIFMEPIIHKTIEEFVRTDGQYTTMVKIPVKKTQLHNELKKQQNPKDETVQTIQTQNPGSIQSIPTSTNVNQKINMEKKALEKETPAQRLARRKEEQRSEQEEKMKNAARESLMARNQDKERKNKELQGNINITSSKLNQVRSSQKIQPGASQSNFNSQQEQPIQPMQYPPYGQNPGYDPSQQYYAQQRNMYEVPSPGYHPYSSEYPGGGFGNPNPNVGSTFDQNARISQASAFSMNDNQRDYVVILSCLYWYRFL